MKTLFFSTRPCKSLIIFCLFLSAPLAWAEEPTQVQKEASATSRTSTSKPESVPDKQAELAEKVAVETVAEPEADAENKRELGPRPKGESASDNADASAQVGTSEDRETKEPKLKPERKRVKRSVREFIKGGKKRGRFF